MQTIEQRHNPIWLATAPLIVFLLWSLACGAGGATFGENAPGDPQYGGGTYVDDAYVDGQTPDGVGENGSLAVDPDTEYIYTVQVRQVPNRSCDPATDADCPETVQEKRLIVVTPDGDAREMLDVTDYVDVRVLFPASSVLIMAEPRYSDERLESGACMQPEEPREATRCGDELFWFDKTAQRKLRELRTNARYHGTRLSPKRNYVVVADNFQQPATVHLVDATNGRVNVVPQEGDWFEGQWMRTEDVFVTAHFNFEDDESKLTIREWFPGQEAEAARQGETLCFYDGPGDLGDCRTFEVDGIDPQFVLGFSWIGVSPEDRYVAVPAKLEDGGSIVIVVDREEGSLDFYPGAHGPVGFTPDGNSMIAFGWDDEENRKNAHLVVIDLATGETTYEPVPQFSVPTFFVGRDGADVVVVNTGGSAELIVVDLDQQETTHMAGPAVAERQLLRYENLRDRPSAEPGTVDPERQPVVVERADVVDARNDAVCVDNVCSDRADVPVTLSEFVSRAGHHELWLIESERLLRLDLERGELYHEEIDGRPSHINILPRRDRLVIDARGEQRLRFYDPARRRVDSETSIELGWR